MADGIVTLKERLSDGVPGRVACRAAPSPSWDHVAEDLRWAETHFCHAATLVDGDRLIDTDGLSDETCRMALMHILQSGYNAVEAAMLRIMLVLDEEPPSGEDWSFLLVRQLSRPGEERPALPTKRDLVCAVHGLRSYRIVARQAGRDFDLDEAVQGVRDAEVVLAGIGPALARFRAAIDPD